MATGVLFGLAVAQRINDLVTAPEGEDRGPAALDAIIRRTLVVAEVALAVMLVIGAGC